MKCSFFTTEKISVYCMVFKMFAFFCKNEEPLLQEEIPGHIPGVCKTSLCDLCPDRVDDGGLFLVLEQVCDGPAADKLNQKH